MRVKISWDEGSTFEPECDLTDAIPPLFECEEYDAAWNELDKNGLYWTGGGAAPLALIVLAQSASQRNEGDSNER